MRHEQTNIEHTSNVRNVSIKGKVPPQEDFVLEKSIFNNVFEKDIQRVFIYKKAERLAKAIHLIAPAFGESVALRNRIDAISIGLVDAAIHSSGIARAALSRELLALSSVLSIARTGGLLSAMNSELIAREAHLLLKEVAEYEEPRILLDETPTLSHLANEMAKQDTVLHMYPTPPVQIKPKTVHPDSVRKGGEKDISEIKDTRLQDRREAILSIIKNKPTASIKDISAHIRNVSEKTVQRELIALIAMGLVVKEGERRWSKYSLI